MLIVLVVYKRSKFGQIFTYRDILLSLVLIFSFNMVLLTIMPVTIERSISVFMLGYMNKNSKVTFTEPQMSVIFEKKYVHDYKQIQARLNEQSYSGTIVQKNGQYQITNRGKLFVRLFSIIAYLFNVNPQLIK